MVTQFSLWLLSYITVFISHNFPVAQTVKSPPAMRETWVQSLGQEDLLEKEMQTTPVFLPGKSHGWRSLAGYSPWGRKESAATERLHFHFPEVRERRLVYMKKIVRKYF